MSQSLIVVFDLGKVLVDFDYHIAVSQIAARSKLPPDGIKTFLGQSHAIIDTGGIL